jgi:hypothetical protein
VKDVAMKRDDVSASPNDVGRQCALFSVQAPAQRHAEFRLSLYCNLLQSFERFRFGGGSLPQSWHPNASRSSASRAGGSRRCTVYVSLSARLAVGLRVQRKIRSVLALHARAMKQLVRPWSAMHVDVVLVTIVKTQAWAHQHGQVCTRPSTAACVSLAVHMGAR